VEGEDIVNFILFRSKIKNFAESKRVFKTLMEELYLIVNAKQF